MDLIVSLIYCNNFYNKDKFSLCLIITITLIFLAESSTLLKENYLFIKIVYVLNYLIFMISYLTTMLINPGIPERKYYSDYIKNKNIINDNWRCCYKCNIIVPKEYNISHCDDCDICVREQDHHCPWTGKCIAKFNLKIFYIFLNSLFIFIVNIFVTLYCNLFYNNIKKK